LEEKMTAAGFAVERQFFFNKAGVIAWWIAIRFAAKRRITRTQLRIYKSASPLFKVLDRCLPMSGLLPWSWPKSALPEGVL